MAFGFDVVFNFFKRGQVIIVLENVIGPAGFYFDFFVLERKEKEELVDDDEEEPPKVEAKDDEADFGTLDNKVQENPMKKALFTQENSRRDNQMMDDESEEEGRQQGSDVQSKSSFSNI